LKAANIHLRQEPYRVCQSNSDAYYICQPGLKKAVEKVLEPKEINRLRRGQFVDEVGPFIVNIVVR